jgi:hypothetical protein
MALYRPVTCFHYQNQGRQIEGLDKFHSKEKRRIAHEDLAGKTKEKRQFRKLRSKLKVNIIMDTEESG